MMSDAADPSQYIEPPGPLTPRPGPAPAPPADAMPPSTPSTDGDLEPPSAIPEEVRNYMENAQTFRGDEPGGPLFNPNVEALNPGGQADEGPPYFGANIPRRFEQIRFDPQTDARAAGYSWPEIND